MHNPSTATELHDLPALPGFTFRRFQGPSDYPHMVAIIAAAKTVDQVERTDTVEMLASAYSHLTNCDPYQDMLFVEMDGLVVAYNRCMWDQEENGPRVYTHIGFSNPAARGQGVGSAAVRWAEARLRAIAAGHPTGTERLFQTFANSTETARLALLESEGYADVRHGFAMVRSLREPVEVAPLPAGLEVRPVLPEHYRAIFDASAEAFRDHWGYVPPTEADYASWQDNHEFQPEIFQVAWDTATGEVAGMVQNFINHRENEEYHWRRGYTEGISVRRPYRRLGLARALLTRSLRHFQDQGMTEAALGVDTENPNGALRLYESVGFRVTHKQSSFRKPMA